VEVSRTANTLLAQLLLQQHQLNSRLSCKAGKLTGREVKATLESFCQVTHSYYARLHYTAHLKLVDKILQNVNRYLNVIGQFGPRFPPRNNVTFLNIPSLIACRTNYVITRSCG
jgi:hypothetical protein